MFDWIGSYELIFILILAGIVMGPQRIAKFARWLGQTTAYLQNISRGFAAQLKNELDAIDDGGDMKEMLTEMRSLQQEVNTLRQQINETATAAITQTKDAVEETKSAVENSIRPPTLSPPETESPDAETEEDKKTPHEDAPVSVSNGTVPPPPASLPNLIDIPDDQE